MGKLTPEEYWEWRTTIAEMQNAEAEHRVNTLKASLMAKDIEISQLKLNSFKAVIRSSEENKKAHDSEYKRFKGKLEERLGISLDNKVIDDLTFEVREIDNGTN